ncbi:sulfotransferase domain-containing protein [Ectothiorhodospira mobilis]|uniref:sulfotransferase domain-containing protein n=1 Tax=Ectothiorhodospira mobilis TaxID=195064 RepID=UPI001903D9A6|nr:sulfotransferase domain-containing protein [Ectothiorhodospira mobilis]
MDKTVVLGLGGQKCGTTWVHRYISADRSFVDGLVKEYHVWDRREIKLFKGMRRNLSGIRCREDAWMWALERFPGLYFKHFSRLLEDGGIAADITPSYSGLTASCLARIRDEFESKGVKVKVIFLMRDPVQRCISAVKHNRARGGNREGVPRAVGFTEALDVYYQSEHAMLRTKYENTVNNIDRVFGDDQVFLWHLRRSFYPT